MNNIRIDKRILLITKQEIEKCFFFLNFSASDTSLNNLFYKLELYRHGVKVQMEGNVSQISFKCSSFCFMKSRRKCVKNMLKVSRSEKPSLLHYCRSIINPETIIF